MWLLHASENFPVFYHSTSFILSACSCCMGKGSYRNTKHKYVIRGFGADVWFSLWFLSVCFVFYGTLSKNDHAVPTCWSYQTKPQNQVLFHMELCCGPCYLLEPQRLEHPNIFQGTGQHWLIFQENKGINLTFGDRKVAIWNTHPFLCIGHTHLLLSVGSRSVWMLY